MKAIISFEFTGLPNDTDTSPEGDFAAAVNPVLVAAGQAIKAQPLLCARLDSGEVRFGSVISQDIELSGADFPTDA